MPLSVFSYDLRWTECLKRWQNTKDRSKFESKDCLRLSSSPTCLKTKSCKSESFAELLWDVEDLFSFINCRFAASLFLIRHTRSSMCRNRNNNFWRNIFVRNCNIKSKQAQNMLAWLTAIIHNNVKSKIPSKGRYNLLNLTATRWYIRPFCRWKKRVDTSMWVVTWIG